MSASPISNTPQQQALNAIVADALCIVEDILDDLLFMKLELEDGEMPNFPNHQITFAASSSPIIFASPTSSSSSLPPSPTSTHTRLDSEVDSMELFYASTNASEETLIESEELLIDSDAEEESSSESEDNWSILLVRFFFFIFLHFLII